MSIESLNKRFSNPHVRFRQHEALVMVDLENDHGQASLTTFGATLLSYRPRGGEDLLWVSETALYDGKKPVRGGVPVCWPWFGAYDPAALGADPSDAHKKGHGVARYALWDVESVETMGDATQVVFVLRPDDEIRKAWPLDFVLRLKVSLGQSLEMTLVGENLSDRDWQVSEAFHTYFSVADAEGLVVRGLDGTPRVDKLAGGARGVQAGEVRMSTPMEQVFLGHGGPLVIEDRGNGREIVIERESSASSVLWNPGPEGVKAFADMPDDQYRKTVCVEVANALEDAYALKAGASHSMRMRLSVGG
ncbi:D-hexose-6-phosphate mutarotase [Thioalkalivibrio sulfidiphilus]|uniref:D-hexose-6-phosphate mutarotase n=1 Tax=Thioalkalivibrio sulfidiphilus TaxID=1033854 RepID=UPI003B2D8E6E